MLALHFKKARHSRAQTQLFGICGIDSANHRLGHALKCLNSQAAAHKLREAFVSVAAVLLAARQQQVEGHARFARPTKNVALNKRPKARGRQQMKTFRHGQQSSLPHNEAAAVMLVCFYQARFEAEPFDEFQCCWFF